VIAVFEVKKTLYSDDFSDSYTKLRGSLSIHGRYVRSGTSSQRFDISPACRAFAEATGIIPPPHKEVSKLALDKEMIYHTLVTEQLSPIRMVLGYNGFKSAHAFREAQWRFLKNNLGQPAFGVDSFPQLAISGQFSLVKLNGQPYGARLVADWWPFLASSSINPVQLLLEFIWTRLAYEYSLVELWGEDLELENFNPCLMGRINEVNDKTGWEYEYINLNGRNTEQISAANRMGTYDC
jgi:hypothetical protein